MRRSNYRSGGSTVHAIHICENFRDRGVGVRGDEIPRLDGAVKQTSQRLALDDRDRVSRRDLANAKGDVIDADTARGIFERDGRVSMITVDISSS